MKTSAGIYFSRAVLALLCAAALFLAACSSSRHETRRYKPSPESSRQKPAYGESSYGRPEGGQGERAYRRIGVASWYGPDFHGKLTSSGEPYDMHSMTCAHKTLPMGTKLKVTNVMNRRSVLVTVTDRGPFVKDREIDLSYAAAKELEMIGPGTATVELKPVGYDERYVQYIRAYLPEEQGPFTVQLASFSDRTKALGFIKGLDVGGQGREPYIFEADAEGGRLYRVRVGKFKTRDEAQSLANALSSEGYSTFVCRYEEQI